MVDAPPILELRDVGKQLGGDWIFRHVSFVVRAGETVGLIGPGGHGKSVLLRLIAGLFEPDEGQVLVEGRDLATMIEVAARNQVLRASQIHSSQDFSQRLSRQVERNFLSSRPESDQS